MSREPTRHSKMKDGIVKNLSSSKDRQQCENDNGHLPISSSLNQQQLKSGTPCLSDSLNQHQFHSGPQQILSSLNQQQIQSEHPWISSSLNQQLQSELAQLTNSLDQQQFLSENPRISSLNQQQSEHLGLSTSLNQQFKPGSPSIWNIPNNQESGYPCLSTNLDQQRLKSEPPLISSSLNQQQFQLGCNHIPNSLKPQQSGWNGNSFQSSPLEISDTTDDVTMVAQRVLPFNPENHRKHLIHIGEQQKQGYVTFLMYSGSDPIEGDTSSVQADAEYQNEAAGCADDGADGNGDDEIGEVKIGWDKIGADEIGDVKIGEDEIGADEIGDVKTVEDKIGADEIGDVKTVEDEIGADEIGDVKTVEDKIGADEIGDVKTVEDEIGADEICDVKTGEEKISDNEIGANKVGEDKINDNENGVDIIGDDKIIDDIGADEISMQKFTRTDLLQENTKWEDENASSDQVNHEQSNVLELAEEKQTSTSIIANIVEGGLEMDSAANFKDDKREPSIQLTIPSSHIPQSIESNGTCAEKEQSKPSNVADGAKTNQLSTPPEAHSNDEGNKPGTLNAADVEDDKQPSTPKSSARRKSRQVRRKIPNSQAGEQVKRARGRPCRRKKAHDDEHEGIKRKVYSQITKERQALGDQSQSSSSSSSSPSKSQAIPNSDQKGVRHSKRKRKFVLYQLPNGFSSGQEGEEASDKDNDFVGCKDDSKPDNHNSREGGEYKGRKGQKEATKGQDICHGDSNSSPTEIPQSKDRLSSCDICFLQVPVRDMMPHKRRHSRFGFVTNFPKSHQLYHCLLTFTADLCAAFQDLSDTYHVCSVCGDRFSDENGLERHLEDINKHLQHPQHIFHFIKTCVTEGEDDSVSSPLVFFKQATSERHQPVKMDNFTCNICDSLFRSIEDVVHHIGRIHYECPYMYCEECGAVLMNPQTYSTHVSQFHKDSVIDHSHITPCSDCVRNCESVSACRDHIKACHADSANICTVCGHVAISKKEHLLHTFCHDARSYKTKLHLQKQCPVCGTILLYAELGGHLLEKHSRPHQLANKSLALTAEQSLLLQCSFCDKEGLTPKELFVHRASLLCPAVVKPRNNAGSWLCKKCKIFVRTYHEWMLHAAMEHVDKCSVISEPNSAGSERANEGDSCQRELGKGSHRSPDNLPHSVDATSAEPSLAMEDLTYQCPVVWPGNSMQCPLCARDLGLFAHKRIDFEKHVVSHVEEAEKFVCEQCGCVCGSKQYLELHAKTHSSQKLVECKVCGKQMLEGASRRHARTHLEKKQCPYCNEYFRHLTSHIMSQHQHGTVSKWLQKCPICKWEKVCSKMQYWRHMYYSHRNKSKVYECRVCNKQFTDQNAKNTHERSHDERMFVCELCGKKFHQKCTLTRHMTTHTRERPYKCSWCPQTFPQSYPLSKHIKSRHPEEYGGFVGEDIRRLKRKK